MEELRWFLERAREDPRVGPVHISLWVVLWEMGLGERVMRVKSLEVMRRAKIASRGTYYLRMKELRDFGYIEYWGDGWRGGGSGVKIPLKHLFNII